MSAVAHAEVAIAALRAYRGDDLERAKLAFCRYTPLQMQEPHGESGQTRAELLAGYEAHRKEIDGAIAWLMAVKPPLRGGAGT